MISAIGVFAFAFMCHHNTFMLYGSLKNSTEAKWGTVTHISVGSSFLVRIAHSYFSCIVSLMYVNWIFPIGKRGLQHGWLRHFHRTSSRFVLCNIMLMMITICRKGCKLTCWSKIYICIRA